ncbi:MAG TPA: hypothetical protein PK906_17830 [Spirochaetota bacterium]|nr:hypothetical protein [Spirochaetota bacterium]
MKRFFTLCMALLFAGTAFAQDAQEKKGPEFKYSFFGIAYGAMGSCDDYEYDYAHVRVRPVFTMGNENVKGVVRLEIDQDFGEEASDSGADNGTDNKVVEVKWAYIDVKDAIVPGLSLTAGLNGYAFPMAIDNDFAMAKAAYDFGMGKAELAFLKHQEYDYVTKDETGVKTEDDRETFAIQIPVKAGSLKITPAYAYTKIGKDVNDDQWDSVPDGATLANYDGEVMYHDGNISNYAIAVNGDFGPVSLDVAFDYAKGTVNLSVEDDGAINLTTTECDVKTYAFDAAVGFKVNEMIKLNAFYTLYSGDDEVDDEVTSHVFAMDTFYGAPDGRLFLLDAAGVAANGGKQDFDMGDQLLGLAIYGLSAEAKIGKLSCLAQYAYVTSAKKHPTTDDSVVGQEIDLQASYEVAPKTSVFLEYGYIVAGDDTFMEEDAQELAWGLKTKI